MVFEFSLSISNGKVQNSPFIFPHNTYDYFYVSNHSGGRGRNENTESESKYVCLYIMAGMLYMYYILCMIYAMHLKMEAFFFILWLWVFRLCALCVRYFFILFGSVCLKLPNWNEWNPMESYGNTPLPYLSWKYSQFYMSNFNYFMLQTTLEFGNSMIFVVIHFWMF